MSPTLDYGKPFLVWWSPTDGRHHSVFDRFVMMNVGYFLVLGPANNTGSEKNSE